MDKQQAKRDWSNFFTGTSSRLIIGMTTVICSFLYLFVTRGNEEDNVKIAIIGLIIIVLNYFFGSSKDASDKSKIESAKELSEVTRHNANV